MISSVFSKNTLVYPWEWEYNNWKFGIPWRDDHMVIGIIAILSVIFSALLCAGTGSFAGLAWLWVLLCLA